MRLALVVTVLALWQGVGYAQPSADQVLSDMGFAADAKQRVLNGEFVTTDVAGVSDRDLSIAIAFLVQTTPAALVQQVMSGIVTGADAQVQASGELHPGGGLADLAAVQISSATAQTLANAQAGEALNLSTAEIAAFNAVPGGTQAAVQAQLQQMLLARFRAYRASGLQGIAPYDRGGGSSNTAGDLQAASQAATVLQKYMPGFQPVLTGYPQATAPGMQQHFRWVKYDIAGATTFVLTHGFAAMEGTAGAVVQRQYYVSAGYNAEQAIAGFVPVQQGTLVVYTNHTFTDQVTGFGGAMKRGVGRRMMASKLEQLFTAARKQVAP